ncbi:MAG: hypothetical protein AAF915_18280 [Cyanobacteria bacterium P01_D01_bin.50]
MMSKLQISDLSFCETEFDNNNQVTGGMSIRPSRFRDYSPLVIPSVITFKEFLEGDSSEIIQFQDEGTDSSGVFISKETNNGKVISLAVQGKIPNGSYALSSSFASTMS